MKQKIQTTQLLNGIKSWLVPLKELLGAKSQAMRRKLSSSGRHDGAKKVKSGTGAHSEFLERWFRETSPVEKPVESLEPSRQSLEQIDREMRRAEPDLLQLESNSVERLDETEEDVSPETRMAQDMLTRATAGEPHDEQDTRALQHSKTG